MRGISCIWASPPPACRFRGSLQPAAGVIAKSGGIEAVAKIVGRHRSVVNRWMLPQESGGTGGQVPMRHAQILLREVPGLSEADFFVRPDDPPREAAA